MPDFSHIAEAMLAEAQAQKATTANNAIEALAKGAGAIDVDVASASVALTEAQSLAGVIRLTGAPGAGRVVTVDPDISRAIFFVNATTGSQVIEVAQTGSANVTVPDGGWILWAPD